MEKFEYTAKDKSGEIKTGTITSNSKELAVENLKKQGISPIVVKKAKKKLSLDMNISFLTPKSVKTKDMVIFTRQLSTMINAGVPLVRSLSTMQQQTDNPYFKEVLSDVSKDVEGGLAFADSLAKHPKVFSDVYINMVAAGEAGGILDDILKKLAVQQEKDASIKKKIKSASIYPIVLLVITISAFFGLMLFVVPKIGKILSDLAGPDVELPKVTQIMLSISDTILTYWVFVFIIGGVSIFAFFKYIKTPKGKFAWHMVLLKAPIVSTIVRKVAIARFSRTFASLMAAGVGVIESLEVTGKAIGNVVIERELILAAKEVRNGSQLSVPLQASPYFPEIVSQMLAIGEETGEIDSILIKVADFYEEEVDALVDGLSSIIEPIMIVIMGGMVGLIAYSVMGPIASLSQNI